jgi:hypothetical protein
VKPRADVYRQGRIPPDAFDDEPEPDVEPDRETALDEDMPGVHRQDVQGGAGSAPEAGAGAGAEAGAGTEGMADTLVAEKTTAISDIAGDAGAPQASNLSDVHVSASTSTSTSTGLRT